MKILILSNSDSGLYGFRKELIQKLLAEGNKVELSLPAGKYSSVFQEMGCHYIETSIDRRGMNLVKDIRLFLYYYKMIHEIMPDVVLTYTIKPNIYGGIACRLLHTKYIVNITGLGTAVENKGILSRILLFMYKIGLKNSSQVFFQNESNRLFFQEKKLIKKSRLIPGSGVNLQENCYEEYPKDEEQIRFLFVGRIMKDKGIEELLDCAEKLNNKRYNVIFDLVGGYDEERYQDRMEALQKRGIINYFGRRDDVHFLMKTHHAVILPSYHEGLSNVLLEAAACGRPVLTTDVPGCREAFEDGISGIGFRPKDSDALVSAVERFLRLPYEEKRQMGICGRRKMEQEFDRQIVIDAYIEEISQAVQRRRK